MNQKEPSETANFYNQIKKKKTCKKKPQQTEQNGVNNSPVSLTGPDTLLMCCQNMSHSMDAPQKQLLDYLDNIFFNELQNLREVMIYYPTVYMLLLLSVTATERGSTISVEGTEQLNVINNCALVPHSHAI